MMQKIETKNAPSAIGPYSQAIICGKLMFISGQLAIEPTTGKLLEGSIAQQTVQLLTNIGAIAIAAYVDLSHVVKTTICLKDLDDFSEVNTAYSHFFTDCPPTRSTIQVTALPLDASIEIEAVVSLSKKININ